MSKLTEFFRVIGDFFHSAPTLIFFKPPADSDRTSLGLMFQKTAAQYPERSAIVFEGRELNWTEFNALVNRFARGFKQQGVKRGDCVAVMMENRIELLCSIVALSKIGATAGLINTGLTGRPLAHCIDVIDSVKCVVGEELLPAVNDIKNTLTLTDADYLWVSDRAKGGVCPDWTTHFCRLSGSLASDNLPETEDIRGAEIALYVFTSGTTGLPKPAIVYQRKILSAHPPYSKVGWHADATDRMYICLPLYHITGFLLGACTCFYTGASIFLRRRFSASQFWPEVQLYRTSLFVYVGELCRYLALQPRCAEEQNNPLKTMLGNGLRPDIWDQFRGRFAVQRITEIYGASESNVSFLNILNKDYTIGTGSTVVRLVAYDVDREEMVTDQDGQPVEVARGEAGLMLSQIDNKYKFDGYKNRQDSAAKILTDLVKPGDRWFNTGDIIRQIDVGFAMGLPHYQFVDRVGDTFRWKAENVSTNEVGEILNAYPQIEISNVYGVEIACAEGRAGMAAITLAPDQALDLEALSGYIDQHLAPFARPIFIRIQPQQETTGTFKLFKGQLRKEAYNVYEIQQPLYVRPPNGADYQPLSVDFYQQIIAGKAGY
jgi:citronellyl-CoA synthetase